MARVGAATGSADGSEAAGAAAGTSNSSLSQQLQAMNLQAASPAAATAGSTVSMSPRQQLLQPAAAAKLDSSSLAAGLSPVKQAGPGSWLSDDASLSNVSVAGSAAPSVSGLSAYSASTSTAGVGPAVPSSAPPPAHAQSAPASVQSSAGGAVAVPIPSNALLAELTGSASSSSLQVLGRSPARTVQLPDGSLVLPGMRARPRGQSPEPARGKRPGVSGGSFTGSLGGGSIPDVDGWVRGGSAPPAAGAGVRQGTAAAAAPAGGSHSSSRLGVPGELQPPSAAAVLRHAGSEEGGELLLQLMPEDPETVGEAGMTRRRRISHADGPSTAIAPRGASSSGSESDSSSSSDSSSDTTSAADSAEAEDLLLVPQHLQGSRRQHQNGGSGAAAAGGLVAERVAAVSRSARKYREVRRARLRPAEGAGQGLVGRGGVREWDGCQCLWVLLRLVHPRQYASAGAVHSYGDGSVALPTNIVLWHLVSIPSLAATRRHVCAVLRSRVDPAHMLWSCLGRM